MATLQAQGRTPSSIPSPSLTPTPKARGITVLRFLSKTLKAPETPSPPPIPLRLHQAPIPSPLSKPRSFKDHPAPGPPPLCPLKARLQRPSIKRHHRRLNLNLRLHILASTGPIPSLPPSILPSTPLLSLLVKVPSTPALLSNNRAPGPSSRFLPRSKRRTSGRALRRAGLCALRSFPLTEASSISVCSPVNLAPWAEGRRPKFASTTPTSRRFMWPLLMGKEAWSC